MAARRSQRRWTGLAGARRSPSSPGGGAGAAGVTPGAGGHFHDAMKEPGEVLGAGEAGDLGDLLQLEIAADEQFLYPLELRPADLDVGRAADGSAETLLQRPPG